MKYTMAKVLNGTVVIGSKVSTYSVDLGYFVIGKVTAITVVGGIEFIRITFPNGEWLSTTGKCIKVIKD